MEVIIMVFPKKSHLGHMDHFGPRNEAPLNNSGSALSIVFSFAH